MLAVRGIVCCDAITGAGGLGGGIAGRSTIDLGLGCLIEPADLNGWLIGRAGGSLMD